MRCDVMFCLLVPQ